MKVISSASEDVMIALFLEGELVSTRFGDAIRTELKKDALPVNIIRYPDTTNVADNYARREILSETRGYEQRKELFTGFPKDVTWMNVQITKAELALVKYIKYSYWEEITNGSRLPKDAASTIENGREVFGVSNTGFLDAAKVLRAGRKFPTMIFVGDDNGKLVVLEGHLRLTAFALAWDAVPQCVNVLLGTSAHMAEWSCF